MGFEKKKKNLKVQKQVGETVFKGCTVNFVHRGWSQNISIGQSI